ncbi:nectin-4 [Danio aesculapii]|uniref:nectin-4 n=1 Tax=Danio aesculapii TaxID=1142201 RepID=UPI0024C02095|nr:nectin-4 [Danio aesculapii]
MHLLEKRKVFTLFLWYLKCISTAGVKNSVQSKAVIIGEDATLFCDLTATEENVGRVVWRRQTSENHQPETFFIIHKDGQTEHRDVRDNVRFVGNLLENNGSIQLMGLKLVDDGIYTCILTTVNEQQAQKSISVTVLVPPVASVTGRTHISGAFSVNLASCVASGARPAARVFWKLGALKNSLNTQTSFTKYPDGSFTVQSDIYGAPSKHLDQRKIQCVVQHITLTEDLELDYQINVHYPPDLVVIRPDDSDNPTEAEEYHCEVECNPTPTYIWNQMNESEGRAPHYEGNKLFLPKSSSDWNGVYICTASNQYGSASGSVLHVNHTGFSVFCWSYFAVIFIIVLCISVVFKCSSGRSLKIPHPPRPSFEK